MLFFINVEIVMRSAFRAWMKLIVSLEVSINTIVVSASPYSCYDATRLSVEPSAVVLMHTIMRPALIKASQLAMIS